MQEKMFAIHLQSVKYVSICRKLKAAGVFAVEDVYQTLEAEIDGERDDTSSDDSEEVEDDISTEETVCTIQKLGRYLLP